MSSSLRRSRFRTLVSLLGFFSFTLAGSVAELQAERFIVDDVYGRNLVQFISRATLETIVGVTNQVGGYIEVDPDDILRSPDCYIEVDLKSLKTGIEARDRKMRGEFLEVDVYPKSTFRLEKVIKAQGRKLVDQKRSALIATGVFSLHGFEKPVTVEIDLTYFRESEVTRTRHPGDLIHIVARFDILLSDFGIEIPQNAFLKLDNRQSITVDLFAFTERKG